MCARVALAALAVGWLAHEGLRRGFRDWGRLVIAATCLVPIASAPLALATNLQLAPLAELALFAVCLRRPRPEEVTPAVSKPAAPA